MSPPISHRLHQSRSVGTQVDERRPAGAAGRHRADPLAQVAHATGGRRSARLPEVAQKVLLPAAGARDRIAVQRPEPSEPRVNLGRLGEIGGDMGSLTQDVWQPAPLAECLDLWFCVPLPCDRHRPSRVHPYTAPVSQRRSDCVSPPYLDLLACT